jgi:hypothetical protein
MKRLLVTAEKWALNRAEHAMILLRFGADIRPGLKFFSTIDAKPAQWWNELTEKRRQRYARMGVELAQKCLAQEDLQAAQAIAKIVSRRFPEQLGVSSSQRLQQQQSETVDSRFLPGGEVAEHLDVFREMFQEATNREKRMVAEGLL